MAGLTVFEGATDELEAYTEQTGKFLLPNIDLGWGSDLYILLRRQTTPQRAIGTAWAETADALGANTEMHLIQKRLAYRQALLAAVLIYSQLIQPGTADVCMDKMRELLELEDKILLTE